MTGQAAKRQKAKTVVQLAKKEAKAQIKDVKAEKVVTVTAAGPVVETRHQMMKRKKHEEFTKARDAKRDRQKMNNETLISLRIKREDVPAFDDLLRSAGAAAVMKGQRMPTRSAMARAAVAYMLETANATAKDRAAWIKDILAHA